MQPARQACCLLCQLAKVPGSPQHSSDSVALSKAYMPPAAHARAGTSMHRRMHPNRLCAHTARDCTSPPILVLLTMRLTSATGPVMSAFPAKACYTLMTVALETVAVAVLWHVARSSGSSSSSGTTGACRISPYHLAAHLRPPSSLHARVSSIKAPATRQAICTPR
jgi:hypothetical protein